MKKTLLILMTILFLLAALAACGGVAEPEETPTTTETENPALEEMLELEEVPKPIEPTESLEDLETEKIADIYDYSTIEFGNIQVTDSINLRFLVGAPPGTSEYFDGEDNPRQSEFILAHFLSMHDSIVEFCEYNHEYQRGHQKMVFLFNVDVEHFQWIEIYHEPSYQSGISRNIRYVGDTLFYVDILEANQPFVTTWVWRGSEPARGISFIDEYGNTRVFTFNENFVGDDFPPWGIGEEFTDFSG